MSVHFTWRKTVVIAWIVALAISLAAGSPAHAAGEISLYTENKNITVPPGESVNYSVSVINNTADIQDVKLGVQGIPNGWEYQLRKGSWNIKELSVRGNDSQTVNLEVEVPLQVEKGEYRFNVVAEGFTAMPLTITVSETATFETELSTDKPNMQGHADANFSYSLDLRNRTAEDQLYALTAAAPPGWQVTFNVSGSQVTSAEVDAGASSTVRVDVKPPHGVTEGSYTIPIQADAGSTGAAAEVEVVITGKYDMQLTTPKGLLSADLTAGKSTKVELEVRNTGTTALNDIEMDYRGPVGWDVTFEPKTLESVEPGQAGKVTATITSSSKSIPGDYVTSITATTPEVSSTADFRIAVKTSVLWGWLGILIIAAVVAGIYYLFRKYGRR